MPAYSTYLNKISSRYFSSKSYRMSVLYKGGVHVPYKSHFMNV